jgi:guanyl-specific ribonuclease Sa
MPYISRPITNEARLEALQAAKAKALVTLPADLAFTAATKLRLDTFLPIYETALQDQSSALYQQTTATAAANVAKPNLKMHISHFFQVFNFGISRNVYTKQQRTHFTLDVEQDELPRLITETELATWGQKIINGDAARVLAGGAAMSNPSAADVAAAHASFVSTQGTQSTKKDAFDHEQEDMADLNVEADDLIADIWDEVNFTFRKDSPPSKRRKMREYGCKFKPNPGETPSPDDFSIVGTVTDSITGEPILGVMVAVVSPEVVEVTDEDGKYFVPRGPEGTYVLHAHKAGYMDQEITGVEVVDGELTIINIQLVATDTGTIQGTVTQGGNPVQATLSFSTTPVGVSTNPATGAYSKDSVPAGSVNITCTILPSNQQQVQTTSLPANGVITINFAFP